MDWRTGLGTVRVIYWSERLGDGNKYTHTYTRAARRPGRNADILSPGSKRKETKMDMASF